MFKNTKTKTLVNKKLVSLLFSHASYCQYFVEDWSTIILVGKLFLVSATLKPLHLVQVNRYMRLLEEKVA